MLKNTLLATAMTLSVYVMSTNAEAGHRPTEWYVGLEGGVNLVQDADVVVLPLASKVEAEFDTGWSVFLDAGYRWENNWRVELEAGYRANDVDCVSVGTGPCNGGNWGDISQTTVMANVIHDIPLSDDTTLSIGLGIGADFVQANSPFSNDEDWVFAGQALLELSHSITERLEIVATYRFLTSDDPDFHLSGLQHASFDNENHTFTLGLRFDLEGDDEPMLTTEPPPDLTPPPPEKPEQFVVFFGFNKSNLDKAARNVVAEAATTAITDGFVSLRVTGYTDTSGSAAYNEQLSHRRASAVKKALVEDGVTESAISTAGKGEMVLLVQTKDQEKEPRNRRATIDIDRGGATAPHTPAPAPAPAPAQVPVEKPAPAVKPAPVKPAAPKPAPVPAPKPAQPATPAPAAPATSPAPAAPAAPNRNTGIDDETLAQYHVWIAQARAKHPYTDSEQRMFDVMMCESGGNAEIVNQAGPYSGLFQYSTGTWKGTWNDYRTQNIYDAKAQIFATAQAWQKGMQRQWGCYSNPH
jgi:outer membrane protein OmpA-like peptidoglycan-associated protein